LTSPVVEQVETMYNEGTPEFVAVRACFILLPPTMVTTVQVNLTVFLFEYLIVMLCDVISFVHCID
jgi:hypothetical protein